MDTTVDAAQQLLGDAGYDVTVDTDSGMIVADMTRGLHYAVASITPGHAGLVTQWWSAKPDAPRSQTCEYWPGNVRATVQCAMAVAIVIEQAHMDDVRQAQAAQVPPIIGDRLRDELDGKAALDTEPAQDDAGIDFPGLEEACYGAPDAEPAQDAAAPDSAVTA
jgi:hypothetical protein